MSKENTTIGQFKLTRIRSQNEMSQRDKSLELLKMHMMLEIPPTMLASLCIVVLLYQPNNPISKPMLLYPKMMQHLKVLFGLVSNLNHIRLLEVQTKCLTFPHTPRILSMHPIKLIHNCIFRILIDD